MSQETYCPDCKATILGDFIRHRETVHPPSLKQIVVHGVETAEVVHGQAKE